MTIDYTYSDLSDEEIALHKAQEQERDRKERERKAREMQKARSFRFAGGLL